MRYSQITGTFNQVLAADQNKPVIKLQVAGNIYLSVSAAIEVHPAESNSTQDVTALNFEFGTEKTLDAFNESFPMEMNIESKDENLNGGSISIEAKDYGVYTNNVPLVIDPNEMLIDPSTNEVYVQIVNGVDIDGFFGTVPHR